MTLSLTFQKVKIAYLKCFENAVQFQPLKTISRLTGLAVFGLSYGAFGMTYLTTISFPITILFMDIMWFLIGQKESTYKSAEFFIKKQTTPKSMDRYNFVLMIVKIIACAFCIRFPYLGLYFYVCSFGTIPVALFTKFGKIDPNAIPIYESNFGRPGYGVDGNLTSADAIGGVSN